MRPVKVGAFEMRIAHEGAEGLKHRLTILLGGVYHFVRLALVSSATALYHGLPSPSQAAPVYPDKICYQ